MRPSLISIALPLLAVVASCSDDSPRPEAKDDPTPSPAFSATRSDGSTFEVEGPFTVECRGSGEDDGVTVVRASTPYYTDGPIGSSGLYLEVDPTNVSADGVTFELPLEGSADEDPTVFLYDVEGRRNELNGDRGDSSGTVRVTAATCDPKPRLVVSVDATLGSEFGDGEPVEVVGTLDLTG